MAFDSAFSFKKYVSNICKSAFYHIRDLKRIRIHLNKATAISIANALVSSRLHYCNSLLLGCSEKYKTSLQRVQNCPARAVTRTSRPLLKSLHRLPIKSRIKFKLNLLTYKAYSWVLPHISVIYYISRNTSKHRDPKVRSYYILDRGQKEITAIHRSWWPHRACGINCLLKYVMQNQSLSFGKK